MLHFRSMEHGSSFLRSILLQTMAIAIGLTGKLKSMPPVCEPIDKGSGHDVTPEKGAQISFDHCLRVHSGGDWDCMPSASFATTLVFVQHELLS
jgi:hypothetical protein